MGGSFRIACWPSLREDAGRASDRTPVANERVAACRITPRVRTMSDWNAFVPIADDPLGIHARIIPTQRTFKRIGIRIWGEVQRIVFVREIVREPAQVYLKCPTGVSVGDELPQPAARHRFSSSFPSHPRWPVISEMAAPPPRHPRSIWPNETPMIKCRRWKMA